MNSNIAPQSTQDDAVIRLKCPECSGGLNLRRKHLGISGKCVHCKAPITAVDEAGIVSLKHSAEVQAAAAPKADPAPTAEAQPAIPEAATPASVPVSPALNEEPASQFAPPPMPAADPEVKVVEEASDSTWGFPKRDNEAVEAPPVEEPAESTSAFRVPDATPTSFSSLAAASGLNNEAVKEDEVKTEVAPVLDKVSPEATPGLGFSEKPTLEEASDTATAEPNPAKAEVKATPDPSDLFESKSEPMSSPLFSNGASGGEVNSGWGAKVPNQNHASISPFSTGSAEPDPGFAETLFCEKAEGDTGTIQPKSPFGTLDGSDDAPLASGALFSNAAVSPKPASVEPEKEVILDGDGRPLREMTPEEKEQFASDIMKFGEYNKRSPWVKRLAKFFVTMAVLAGIGYAAYVFLPQEQVKVAKAKVLDWLEPGSVLMDYLPFEVSESEDGEKEVKIKALEGLDNLSNQMDEYLTTAEDQLNETLPEGAEGYKREKPIDTPEMPKMPKIPGLKLPTMPGMPTESGAETAE